MITMSNNASRWVFETLAIFLICLIPKLAIAVTPVWDKSQVVAETSRSCKFGTGKYFVCGNSVYQVNEASGSLSPIQSAPGAGSGAESLVGDTMTMLLCSGKINKYHGCSGGNLTINVFNETLGKWTYRSSLIRPDGKWAWAYEYSFKNLIVAQSNSLIAVCLRSTSSRNDRTLYIYERNNVTGAFDTQPVKSFKTSTLGSFCDSVAVGDDWVAASGIKYVDAYKSDYIAAVYRRSASQWTPPVEFKLVAGYYRGGRTKYSRRLGSRDNHLFYIMVSSYNSIRAQTIKLMNVTSEETVFHRTTAKPMSGLYYSSSTSYFTFMDDVYVLDTSGSYKIFTTMTNKIVSSTDDYLITTGGNIWKDTCVSGRYLQASKDKSVPSCSLCPKGKYSAAERPVSKACVDCPQGTYSPHLGGLSLTSCMTCLAGKYGLRSGSSICKECEKGKYSSTIAANSSSVCLSCAKGKYSETVGASSAAVCIHCGAGKFYGSANAGAHTATVCLDCKAGRYSAIGAASEEECSLCPVGSFQFMNGSAGCSPCPTGSYANVTGSRVCTSCPRNTYADSFGSFMCKLCPSGMVTSTRGAQECVYPIHCTPGTVSTSGHTPCSACPAGKTSKEGATLCDQCPTGKVTASAGSVVCSSCSNMQISSTDQTTCQECGINEIPDSVNRTRCIKCADGQESQNGVCITLLKCMPGEYSETGFGPECYSCPAGRYNPRAGVSGTYKTACLLAPYGEYASGSGNPSAVTCENNQYTEKEGSAVESDCLACSAATVPNDKRNGCSPCSDGEYATSEGTCLKDLNTNSDSNAVEGLLSNNGTPFYILAILVVIIAALGLAIAGTKKGKENLLSLDDKEHIMQFGLNSAGLISELILGFVLTISGDSQLFFLGISLFIARFLVAAAPGVTTLRSIFSPHVPPFDEETRRKNIKYYIDSDVVIQNSKLYVATVFLSVLEPNLLAYLPWYVILSSLCPFLF